VEGRTEIPRAIWYGSQGPQHAMRTLPINRPERRNVAKS
jgi:hypothetical protein